jgi:hypothetical protein
MPHNPTHRARTGNGGTFIKRLDFSINFQQCPPPGQQHNLTLGILSTRTPVSTILPCAFCVHWSAPSYRVYSVYTGQRHLTLCILCTPVSAIYVLLVSKQGFISWTEKNRIEHEKKLQKHVLIESHIKC